MTKRMLILILSVLHTNGFAELVKGPATVYDDDKKYPVISLQDSVTVDADPREGGWYRVAFSFTARVNDFVDQVGTLKKGAVLLSVGGKMIGVTLVEMQVPIYKTKNGISEGVIGAIQIPESNIYADTDIESQFSSIVARSPLGRSDFKAHFTHNSYHRGIDSSSFTTFMKYGAAAEFTPVIRIMAVFDRARLFCVIHYSKIHFPKETGTTSVREFTVTYFASDKKRIHEFEEIYFRDIEQGD
jgi:hypothetical protein